MIRVAAFARIPETIESLGADPAVVCAAAGLDLKIFGDPENQITYRAASHLYRVCTQETACPHFGLLVGSRAGLEGLGFVGLLARYAPDVRTAVHNLVSYLRLRMHGATATVEETGKVATFGYEIHAPGAEATDQIADGSLAMMLNMMVTLCGRDFRPVEVRFEHRKPDNLVPYNRFFQAPLHFEMDENALVFACSHLDRTLPAVDPELTRLLRDTVRKLEAQAGDDLPEQVRSVLRTALLVDQGHIEQVAAMLGVHSRTLHRRLAEYGTNFRGIVDEVRYEIARQMLEDTRFDVAHIAGVLDYADTSAFARAFRRWSGSTPSHWRAGLEEPD